MQEKLLRLYADAKILVPLLLLCIAVLSIPSFIREDSSILIGREAYYHLRIAEKPLERYDEFSYGGRPIIFRAYPLALSIFSKTVGIDLVAASKIMPLLFGLISILLFYFILKKIELDKLDIILACLVLIISPTFLYTFGTSNSYSAPLTLSLLSFLLLLHNKKILAYVLLALIAFFGLAPFLIAAMLAIGYLFKSKGNKWIYLLLLTLVSVIVIKFGLPDLVLFRLAPEEVNFRIQMFFSEFGSEIGISVFAIILAFFGLKHLWQKKYEHLTIYAAILMLIIVSILEIKTILYLNFIVAVLAALGITRLLYKKWESVLLNVILSLLLLTGLVLSLVVHAIFLSGELPNKDIIDGLDFIRQESKETDVVFSYYRKGYWINYFGRRANVMDENFFYAPNISQRYEDSNILFYSRDINKAMEIIDGYGIKYIWIDKAMKNGKVWKENDEGLLFLLSASKRFKKDYSNDYVEIWKVVK